MSAPWNTMRPESGGMRPLIRLIRVVLPAPLEPMRASTSPSVTVKSTWSTAWVSPKDLVSWVRLEQAHAQAPFTGALARGAATVPTMPVGQRQHQHHQHDAQHHLPVHGVARPRRS